MKFCDKFCCFPTKDCENIGEIALNSSGYHKVCNFHYDSVQNMILCGYCESLVMITCKAYAPEENNSPVISQDYDEEIIFCILCMESHEREYHKKLKYFKCFKCQEDILENEKICNHIKCDECSQYFYCPNCLSSEFSNTLKNYYFFKCGHLTCEHKHVSNTSLYTPDGQVKNCSICKIPSYIFREYTNFTENHQNFYCWKCINIDNSICTMCHKQNGLKSYEGKLICQECANNLYQVCESCNNYYQHLDCGHYGCYICEGVDKCKSCKYQNYSSSNYCQNCNEYDYCYKCDCDHLRCSECLRNKLCLACNQEGHQYASNSNQIMSHDAYEEQFGIPELANDSDTISIISQDMGSSHVNTVFRQRECPNCGNYSELYRFDCTHEGCLHCSHKPSCNKCLILKNKCINCENKHQKICLFDCEHIACYDCISGTCNKCNPNKEKKKCSRCLKMTFICRPYKGDRFECEHGACFSCISKNEICKKCKSEELSIQSEKINASANQNILENEEEKKSESLLEKNALKSHYLIVKSEERGHSPAICNKCNRISSIYEILYCGHNICKDCMESNSSYNCPRECSLRMCNMCKSIDICMPAGIKKAYICKVCIKGGNIKPICCYCKNENRCQKLKCGHLICNNCNAFKKNECSDCMNKAQYCFICYSKNFEKIVNSCGHISCTKCFLDFNKTCLDCCFGNQSSQASQFKHKINCKGCKQNILNGFKLLCLHYVCDNCTDLTWKFFNFKCLDCYSKQINEEICLSCFRKIKFQVSKTGIFKECCNKYYEFQ